MMKKIILAILATLPIVVTAQKGITISAYYANANTNLYNKEDKEGYIFSNGFPCLLPYTTTYSPSYGVNVGMGWRREKAGLKNILIGAGYLPFVQNYKGPNYASNGISNASGFTKLNYYSFPFQLTFALTKPRIITPVISIGATVFKLINYEDMYKGDLWNPWDSSTFTRTRYITGNIIDITEPQRIRGKFSTWYYDEYVVNSYLSLGACIKINNYVEVGVDVYNTYSFTNPESNDEKFYEYSDPFVLERTLNPYKYYFCKINLPRDPRDVRDDTKIINTGVQIKLLLNLFTKSND